MLLTNEQTQQLLSKAMKDDAFRQALRHDARAAIATELHLTLPPEVLLHVLEPGPNDIYQILPPYPADWPPGLSAEVLEQRLIQGLGNLEEAQQTIARGQTRLIAKSWHDASYKQALLANPKAVVQREFGVPLPPEVTVQVFAEDAHTQYLVLPPALSDLELSDDQLEQVAGGEVALVTIITLIVSSVAGSAALGFTGYKAGW
jgi:hypothetical protein